MGHYTAPLDDMRFVMKHLAQMDEIGRLAGNEGADVETVAAILDEAGKFAAEVLAPLNKSGDREGAVWRNGEVSMPRGFKEAYAAFVANGWNGIGCDEEYGGHGMPKLVTTATREMWNSANMAFALCPALNAGAIEALELSASDTLKHIYLEKMVSGEWTGTMNLTEPQAGSDLAAVRARATPQPDGTFRIVGQKIFITYGDHDMAENIVHLVLARLPDAPAGVKGISLFLAPKFLVNPDGSLGERNDARCVSIEHKLGIHASPTCVMSFGDGGGAIGYLVGEPNRGLEYMFIMMNDARLVSGVQGLAVAERAYQKAAAFAKERVQGRDIAGGSSSVPIITHPDVRRMLLLMKSLTEAMRALAYTVAGACDLARAHPDKAVQAHNQAFVDLMTPVLKGWCTETGIEVATIGIQVHGGMGYIEETGAAQYLRDVRITAIYEGTTGIQANDLIGRKIAREDGKTIRSVMREMRLLLPTLTIRGGEDFGAICFALRAGIDALDSAVAHILETYSLDIRATAVGAVPFLKLAGIVTGGWLLARTALAAAECLDRDEGDKDFLEAKIGCARFFADHVLAQAPGFAHTVTKGSGRVMVLAESQF